MSILSESANTLVDLDSWYHVRSRGSVEVGVIRDHIKSLQYPINKDYSIHDIYLNAKEFTEEFAPKLRIEPEFCNPRLLGLWFYEGTERKGIIFVQAKERYQAKDISSLNIY